MYSQVNKSSKTELTTAYRTDISQHGCCWL